MPLKSKALLATLPEILANNGQVPAGFLPPAGTAATPGTVLASAYGAVGDGVADDSAAIQAALNACPAGCTVVLDAKTYRCASPLTMPDQVGLEGRWRSMATASIQERVTSANRTKTGTVLVIDWAAPSPGDGTQAFLSVGCDGRVAGINFFDKQQGTTSTGFVSRPWFLGLSNPTPGPTPGYGTAANGYSTSLSATIERVNLINPYRGIRLWGMGRITVRDVVMSPLVTGLWMDQQGDTSVLDGIHIVPIGWYDDSGNYPTAIQNYIQANLIAYRFGRVDSVVMSNCMVYSCNIGVRLELSALSTQPREPWLRMVNVDLDVCDVGLDILATAAQGCMYTGGSITAATGGPNQIGIRTGAGTGGFAFANLFVQSFAGAEVRMAGGNLAFTGCTFNSFGHVTTGTSPSIQATGGNLALAGCTFNDARPPVSWQATTGACRTAATLNLGGATNVDPNVRINIGGNS